MISCTICQEEISSNEEVSFLNENIVHSGCLPNIREGEEVPLVVDLRDDLPIEEETQRLHEIIEIVEQEEYDLEKAQEEVDRRFKQ